MSIIFQIKKFNSLISPPKYLYHLTFYKNIDSILENGLNHGFSSAVGRGGYAGYSAGKTFLTDLSGVKFWYSKMEENAQDLSDNIIEDQMIPVVLRIDVEGLEMQTDEIGSKDSSAQSFTTTLPIEPEYIDIWDGSSWVSLEDEIDLHQAITIEEDNDETLIYFKPTYSNKLIP